MYVYVYIHTFMLLERQSIYPPGTISISSCCGDSLNPKPSQNPEAGPSCSCFVHIYNYVILRDYMSIYIFFLFKRNLYIYIYIYI